MKKIVCLILALVLLLAASACGETASPVVSSAPTATPDT